MEAFGGIFLVHIYVAFPPVSLNASSHVCFRVLEDCVAAAHAYLGQDLAVMNLVLPT